MKTILRLGTAGLLCLSVAAVGRADCPCNGFTETAPAVAVPLLAPGGLTALGSAYPLLAAAPPPGTLGTTYTRISHPIPEHEHPRTAMLAVRDQGCEPYLQVQRMGGYRMKNGIWLFESERPLIPGVEQIVRVEARQNAQDVQPHKTKFVRLIPGRIVYLDF